MHGTSPPSCGARSHRAIFAARGGPSARELRSAKWCQSKFYDSNVCHIAPRVLEKCPVHALSASVENTKNLMGCEYWCEAPVSRHYSLDFTVEPRNPRIAIRKRTDNERAKSRRRGSKPRLMVPLSTNEALYDHATGLVHQVRNRTVSGYLKTCSNTHFHASNDLDPWRPSHHGR